MKRSFAEDAITTSVSQILMFVFGIGTSIIIARVLGPERKGTYVLVLLFASFLAYYTTFGLHQAAVFYLGRKLYSEREVFGHSLIYALLLSVLAIGCGLAMIRWFADRLLPGVSPRLLLFGLLMVPAQLFFGFLAQILLGLGEIRRYNVVQIVRVSALLMAVVVLLLWLAFGIQAALAAELIAFLFPSLILFIVIWRRVGGLSMKLNLSYLKHSITYGSAVYLGNTLAFLHYRVDMFLINLFLNPAMVGLYSVSAGLSEKLSLISDGTATVLFPKISSEADPSKIRRITPLVFRTVLLLVVSVAVLLALVAPWLITVVYSDAFAGSIRPFRILLLGAVSIAGWSILESDFKGRGRPIWSTATTLVSVVMNIILNILWIPRYGITGAAYASCVSYSAALLIALMVYCRLSGNSLADVLIPGHSDLELYRQLGSRLTRTFVRAKQQSGSHTRAPLGAIHDKSVLSR